MTGDRICVSNRGTVEELAITTHCPRTKAFCFDYNCVGIFGVGVPGEAKVMAVDAEVGLRCGAKLILQRELDGKGAAASNRDAFNRDLFGTHPVKRHCRAW